MTPTDRPTVRIASTTDLLALIPFLLGFQPDSSLILAVLDPHGLPAVVRLDLTAVTDPAGPTRDAVGQVAATVRTYPSTRVVLAGYGPADQVEPAVTAIIPALRDAGITVHEALRVADGRYWRLAGDPPRSCPANGVAFDPTTSPVTTTAVYAGLVALPDRDALAATFAPVTGPARDGMRAATATACAFLTDLMDTAEPTAGEDPDAVLDTPLGQALQRAARTYLRHAEDSYRQGQPVRDEPAALLIVLLELPSLREYATRRASGEQWQIQMWTDLQRRAEPEFAATPAILLTLCALLSGNGAIADMAIQRALAADPDDRLAHLLAAAVAAGITPTDIAALLTD